MKSFLHERVELAEAYALGRGPMEADDLNALFRDAGVAAVAAAKTHFGPGVELLVHLERTPKGPALRATVTARTLGKWFPRGKSLRAAAGALNQRGRLFTRHVIAAVAKHCGGVARKEERRKAPGKLSDLWDRISPAGMLQVARFADLAAKERTWLSDEIASLRRTVHGAAKFTRLMTRLKSETRVSFLPTTDAELANLKSKLVGVASEERHLHLRRRKPSFAGQEREPAAILARMHIGARGVVTTYYSD
jgi:hypothetical protein